MKLETLKETSGSGYISLERWEYPTSGKVEYNVIILITARGASKPACMIDGFDTQDKAMKRYQQLTDTLPEEGAP